MWAVHIQAKCLSTVFLLFVSMQYVLLSYLSLCLDPSLSCLPLSCLSHLKRPAGKCRKKQLSGSESGFLVSKIVNVVSLTFVLHLASVDYGASGNWLSESASVLLSCVVTTGECISSDNVGISYCVVTFSCLFGPSCVVTA